MSTQIQLVNYQVGPALTFLRGITLKGRDSRFRSRFNKILRTRLEELAEDEKVILQETCNLNEDGSLKFIEGTENLDMRDPMEYYKQQQALAKEVFTIGSPEVQETLDAMKSILEEYNGEVSGEDADALDYLCTAFDI